MAQKDYYFSGEARWAKLQRPDEKYNKHSIEIKLDEKGIAEYKSSGLQGGPSKDGLGYYTFRRDPKQLVWSSDNTRQAAGKPTCLGTDGAPFGGLIGNGSTCTIKVTVYSYDNSFGKGFGGRLEAVRVDNLVEYTPDTVAVGGADVSSKVRIPF